MDSVVLSAILIVVTLGMVVGEGRKVRVAKRAGVPVTQNQKVLFVVAVILFVAAIVSLVVSSFWWFVRRIYE